MSSLISIVSWSQTLACEVLRPGDVAVDLTAGKGRDTHALAKGVGSTGQIVAFDLQAAAIEQSTAFLQKHGFEVNLWLVDQPLPEQPGIFLIQACHSTLGQMLQHPAKVIMANLGYLPGSDHAVVTHPDSTLVALQHSLALLAPGGRLVVTIYPSHLGGEAESDAVEKFFYGLSRDQWQVLSLNAVNHGDAPYLLVAERTI